ncbi:MAG: hypothetical protein WB778_04145 [Thermoplasmata archaeon]
MEPERIGAIRAELEGSFGPQAIVYKATADGRHLFKIERVPLPPGCNPPATEALLVYPPGSDTPEIYARQGIVLPNGAAPKNTYPTVIEGEAWMKWSAQWSWNSSESITVNLMRKIWRFRWGE